VNHGFSSFGYGIDRKGPTLARIEQHVFKRKCWLALNSIAERYLYACRAAD